MKKISTAAQHVDTQRTVQLCTRTCNGRSGGSIVCVVRMSEQWLFN